MRGFIDGRGLLEAARRHSSFFFVVVVAVVGGLLLASVSSAQGVPPRVQAPMMQGKPLVEQPEQPVQRQIRALREEVAETKAELHRRLVQTTIVSSRDTLAVAWDHIWSLLAQKNPDPNSYMGFLNTVYSELIRQRIDKKVLLPKIKAVNALLKDAKWKEEPDWDTLKDRLKEIQDLQNNLQKMKEHEVTNGDSCN